MDIEFDAEAIHVHRLRMLYRRLDWTVIHREGDLVELADLDSHSIWLDLSQYDDGVWDLLMRIQQERTQQHLAAPDVDATAPTSQSPKIEEQ